MPEPWVGLAVALGVGLLVGIELAARAGITVANLSVLKNGRARAVRFSTLTALCDALGCTPGDLFSIAVTDGRPRA